ncbi:GroES (chaperonin 10)-like protein [Naviculisporaceae sp. PSN 640]
MVLPETQSAIVADSTGNLVLIRDGPLPELGPDMVLIRTEAVALNPADAKFTGPMASEGSTAGCDCAGTVVAIGSEVPPGPLTLGQRVCGPLAPMDPLLPSSGAFAEYVALTADLTLTVPGAISMESASGLGTSLTTVALALFRSLGIPGRPDAPCRQENLRYQGENTVLVHGASSATGTMAIQLIKRSGCIPIAACSPHNFDLVKSYGAAEVWDYNDPSTPDKIKSYTRNALCFALDCACDPSSSMNFCYSVIGRAGGRYTTLEPYPEEQASTRSRRVKPDWVIGASLLGREIGWKEPYHVKADPGLRQFGREWMEYAQGMLDRGEIRPHPVRVGKEEGLEHVLEGIDMLRKKKVSGEKLVYKI